MLYRATEASVLSIRRCRQLAGGLSGLTDNDVERLRDQLSEIARLVVSANKQEIGHYVTLQAMTPERREDVEERAAILEFDSAMPRSEATQKALETAREIPKATPR